MRICVISYHSSPLAPAGSGRSGGMNIFISNLYRILARYHEIDIFTYGEGETCEIGPGVKVIFLDRQDLADFADGVIGYHTIRRYNLIHTHYWLSGIIGLIIKKFVKISWVHTFHTVEIFKGIERDRMRIEVEAEIAQRCDLIISPTNQEASAIRASFPRARVITIPHGVDVQKFTPGVDGSSSLLYVGRIDPIKGLDLLIDALRLLNSEIRLDIIGGPSKGEYELESLKAYASGLRVNFLGPIPHRSLPRYYQRASVVAIPSCYESFGLVGLEAMASARPVVGFARAGLSETVGNDAGILVKRCVPDLARVIALLIDNRELRQTLGSSGRKKALNYEWPNIARRYLITYEKIIED